VSAMAVCGGDGRTRREELRARAFLIVTRVRIDGVDRKNRQRDAAKSNPSLTAPTPESERYRRLLAVGVAASKLAAPIVAKRGGGILLRLKAEWAAIVGPDWAALTWPKALGRDGVLKLHSASSTALELQHRAPLLIERINLFFGRPVIARLALVQGPLPLASPPRGPFLRPLAPSEGKALDERLSEVDDPELRAALARLGRAVVGAEH